MWGGSKGGGWVLGGNVLVPHIDGDRIVEYFGKRPGFRDIERQENVTKMGVPVDVEPEGNL